MLKNYFKITMRNINRFKGYSLINIFGLAIGMACCLLISLWIFDELSFDKYHENAERIFRVGHELNLGGSTRRMPRTSAPMAPAMIEDYPEVIDAVRITPETRVEVSSGSQQFYEENILYADNSIFNIFTFPMIAGDPQKALVTAYSVVITEDMSKKYFADKDALGQTLKVNGNDIFTVTGIMENIPPNSHFTFDMLFSYETLLDRNPQLATMWGQIGNSFSYLLLDEKSDYLELERKFPALIEKSSGDVLRRVGATLSLYLQPLTSIHLHSNLEGEISGNGNIVYVYLFSGIALFILLIACINFINLATARATSRAKEVGMRKTFGAVRGKLISQFLGESILYCVISVLFAVCLLEIFQPLFNHFIGRDVSVNLWQSPWFFVSLLGLIILVGVVAGSYPAFYLSSFQPVKVLKGNLRSNSSNSNFRRILVVIQFTVSIALIVGTLTIHSQVKYMKNKNLGFTKEQVVVLSNDNNNPQRSLKSVKEEFKMIPGIVEVAASSNVPGSGGRLSNVYPEGFLESESQLMRIIEADADFLPALNINIISGRNFSTRFATDSSESIIINETAARRFGWQDPLGKSISYNVIEPSGLTRVDKKVVGVISDFHHSSLHEAIEPLMINYQTEDLGTLSIRIAPENISNTMALIKDKWNALYSGNLFDYYFLDDSFDSQYRVEERLGNLTLSFSFLAVLIGCLGLLGLSSYTAEQRTREIGIRKVMGASVATILRLLVKEFTLLIIIANFIAWPVAYIVMKRWLEGFAYHIDIGLEIFILTGLIALLIAVLSVSYQAVKAAVLNPVDALRHE